MRSCLRSRRSRRRKIGIARENDEFVDVHRVVQGVQRIHHQVDVRAGLPADGQRGQSTTSKADRMKFGLNSANCCGFMIATPED